MNSNIKIDFNATTIGQELNQAKRNVNSALELCEDGIGIQSKSIASIMMAYGALVSASNIMVGLNAELTQLDNETMESAWKDFQDLLVVAQTASQLAENIAEKYDLSAPVIFRNYRSEGREQNHLNDLISEYNKAKKMFAKLA